MSAPQTLQSEALQPSASTPAPAANPLWKYAPLALFSVLWLDLIRLLSSQWEAREQYAYGWFVPIFALALLFRRWQDRPLSRRRLGEGGPLSRRSLGEGGSASWLPSASDKLLFAFIVLLCLFLLPLRVIHEINADWPLISWLHTGIVVVLTLYAVYLADPTRAVSDNFSLQPSAFSLASWRLSPWVRHFAFPIAFILVAVAWPYRIEKGLTQGLMQVVASLTVEILGWFNIPAMQHGNLIELTTGTVGVDEACSGIRSFQSSLMAGLLMGELYRMRLHWRAVLVIAGLGIGFCLNVCRTLLLSWQASKEGLEAIDKWHDPAGMTITVLCFFCLWALAVLLRKWTSLSRRSLGEGGSDPQLQPSSRRSIDESGSAAADSQLSTLNYQPYLILVGAWALFCVIATEAWYRSHESDNAGFFHWSVQLPKDQLNFEPIELAPRTVRLLAYDLADTGKWQDEQGWNWSAHFFRWNPRFIKAVVQGRAHRPEVCLPASGFTQTAGSDLVNFEAGSLTLPFRKYVYTGHGQTLYVFFCQWEDGEERQSGMGASGQTERLRAVRVGRRNVGQQTLEFIITGAPSLDEAEAALRRNLPAWIRATTLQAGKSD